VDPYLDINVYRKDACVKRCQSLHEQRSSVIQLVVSLTILNSIGRFVDNYESIFRIPLLIQGLQAKAFVGKIRALFSVL
jgi:hypothetical protein